MLNLSNVLPCCTSADPERGRAGRCAAKAMTKGWCDPDRTSLCPVACGACVPCLGRCMTSSSSRYNLEGRSILDEAWCSTYPRCAIFDCCSEGANSCIRPSMRGFVEPPPLALYAADHTPLHPRSTHGHRSASATTRSQLEAGISALPFTTAAQFEQLASRDAFRILYVAQG